MALALALLLLALAAAPAAVVGAQRAGAKPPGTLVFAALGDWGWATEGADASFLVNGLRGGCAAFDPAAARAGANASAYRASPGGARCLDGASGVQGILSRLGLQAVAQRATARALAGACARAGGCDAVALTGDSFYPNGVASADDPQWVSAFESVYTPQLFGGAVFASCLGNHCYSTLGTPGGSGAAQVEYSTTRSPRFWLPAPAYDRTFASTDGTTRLQLVVMDSAPLTDAYLYAGASGAGFAPGDTGVADDPSNAVINPGVTVANGFPPHRLFNSTRFACAADGASGRILGPQNCAYASPEFAARAAPASRRAAWESAETALLGGAASGVQHAVLMGHMPVVSVQQRQSPLQADALAMLARLPASAAPQIALSGHDHVLAHLVHPSAPSTEFFISGAGGITSAGATGVAGSPADGAARAGDEWMAALVNATYAPYPPPRGVAASNPDVGLARFYTERNGFLLCSANSSALSCGFFSIDCTDVPTSGACAPSALGPLHTRTFAARPVAPTPAV